MSIVEAKCPNCGGSLFIDPINRATCQYCGSHFIWEGGRLKTDVPNYHNTSTYSNPVKSYSWVPFVIAVSIGLIGIATINSIADTQSTTGTTESSIIQTEDHSTDSDTPVELSMCYLTSLTPYTYSTNGFPFYDIYNGEEDIFGNSYTTGFEGHLDPVDGEASITYRLRGEYSRLDFYLAVPASCRAEPGSGIIRVYSDNTLIFDRSDITSDSETELVSLDITGTTNLTIEMYGYKEPEISIIGFAAMWPMMADPILYR